MKENRLIFVSFTFFQLTVPSYWIHFPANDKVSFLFMAMKLCCEKLKTVCAFRTSFITHLLPGILAAVMGAVINSGVVWWFG